MLGWETGRLMTQDLNWDHMPQLGWAVFSPDGPPVLHEEADGSLVPVSDARAHDLGILGPDGRLAEQRLPTIAECLSVSEITAGHYCADCILDNGRHAEILGESESGDLPDTSWFAGRTPATAAGYRLTEQLAMRRR